METIAVSIFVTFLNHLLIVFYVNIILEYKDERSPLYFPKNNQPGIEYSSHFHFF